MALIDFFSVPLGYVDPDQGGDNEVSPSPVPAEAYQHRGKWLALHVGKILAVKDTRAELQEEFGQRRLGVTFFHVPPTPLVLR